MGDKWGGLYGSVADCGEFHDRYIRGVRPRRIECDEVLTVLLRAASQGFVHLDDEEIVSNRVGRSHLAPSTFSIGCPASEACGYQD